MGLRRGRSHEAIPAALDAAFSSGATTRAPRSNPTKPHAQEAICSSAWTITEQVCKLTVKFAPAQRALPGSRGTMRLLQLERAPRRRDHLTAASTA